MWTNNLQQSKGLKKKVKKKNKKDETKNKLFTSFPKKKSVIKKKKLLLLKFFIPAISETKYPRTVMLITSKKPTKTTNNCIPINEYFCFLLRILKIFFNNLSINYKLQS
jgi:hypothetical protein